MSYDDRFGPGARKVWEEAIVREGGVDPETLPPSSHPVTTATAYVTRDHYNSLRTSDYLDLEEIPVSIQGAKLRHRIDRQVLDIRQRLRVDGSVMLVKRGHTFSAKSVWGVIWLYLKFKLGFRPKQKMVPKEA